jgi:exoribonuclease II
MIRGGTLEVRVVALLILEEEATAAAVVAAAAAVQSTAQGIFNTGFIF